MEWEEEIKNKKKLEKHIEGFCKKVSLSSTKKEEQDFLYTSCRNRFLEKAQDSDWVESLANLKAKYMVNIAVKIHVKKIAVFFIFNITSCFRVTFLNAKFYLQTINKEKKRM